MEQNTILKLPDLYEQIENNAPPAMGIPREAFLYGARTSRAKVIMHMNKVDQATSMPFDSPQWVVDYLHEHMEDIEGLIEVGCGSSSKGHRIIYNILKISMTDETGIPHGNAYSLCLNIEIGPDVYFVNGSFYEEGITGERDNTIFALYRRDHPDLENPFDGWSRDPYDENFSKGFLMNRSEEKQFDEFFPDHPLSVARTLVKYITENN